MKNREYHIFLMRTLWLLILFYTFLLSKNHPVEIADIRINGDHAVEENFIRSFLTLHKGDRLDSATVIRKMESIRESLINTFYYSQVHIYLLDKGNHKKVLLLDVRSNPFPFIIGGGDIYASVERLNWKNRGMDLRLILGYNRNEMQIRRRHLANGKWDYILNLSYTNTMDFGINPDLSGVSQMSYELKTIRFGFFRNLTPRMLLGIVGGYSHFQPYHIPQNSQNFENQAGGFWKFGIQMAADYRDHIFYPEKGFYIFLRFFRAFQSRERHVYNKIVLDVRHYFRIRQGTSMMMRVYGGYISDCAPYSDLFILNDIREFRYSTDARMQGYKFMIGTAEFRKKMFHLPLLWNTWTEMAWFFEGGNVLNRTQVFTASGFKFCHGPAFRIHIPAPVYVDLAFEYALTKDGNVFWFGVRRNL